MCMMFSQVLSVETALSIQSHPDKALAERLHAKSPDVSLQQLCTHFLTYGFKVACKQSCKTEDAAAASKS